MQPLLVSISLFALVFPLLIHTLPLDHLERIINDAAYEKGMLQPEDYFLGAWNFACKQSGVAFFKDQTLFRYRGADIRANFGTEFEIGLNRDGYLVSVGSDEELKQEYNIAQYSSGFSSIFLDKQDGKLKIIKSVDEKENPTFQEMTNEINQLFGQGDSKPTAKNTFPIKLGNIYLGRITASGNLDTSLIFKLVVTGYRANNHISFTYQVMYQNAKDQVYSDCAPISSTTLPSSTISTDFIVSICLTAAAIAISLFTLGFLLLINLLVLRTTHSVQQKIQN